MFSIDLIEFTTQTFIVLFVTMNPIGISPIFASLTEGTDKAYKKSMAQRAIFTVIFIMLMFGLSGDFLLNAMGISFYAFQLAGGVLLFLMAIKLVFSNPKEMSENNKEIVKSVGRHPQDISIFPIAIPLIAGPGSMTTIILQMGEAQENLWAKCLAISMLLLVILITYIMLRLSDRITKLIGISGVNVISRILGILLSSLACQFILDGIYKSGILSQF